MEEEAGRQGVRRPTWTVPGATQQRWPWAPGPQDEHRAQQKEYTDFSSHASSDQWTGAGLECCAERILRTNLGDELATSAMGTG